MTMKIITRDAQNVFDAYRIAQGMENAGASVFSISYDGMHQPFGALLPSSRFIVWAKHEESLSPDDIDKAISKEFGEDDDDEPAF